MYNKDFDSLNAGAPDIRLTGNQQMASMEAGQEGIMAAAPGTYTQKRKDNMMAYGGIAGADGRKAYGLGSMFQKAKDKFIDDIIPNEIKENPMLTAALVGGGINQFGIPFTEGMGQNWLGDLLGAAVPGETQFNTVFGDTLPFRYEDITSNPLPGGFDQIVSETLAKDMSGIMGGRDAALMKIAGMLPDTANVPSTLQRYQKAIADAAKTKSDQSTLKSIYDTVAGDTTRADGTTFNYKIPVAAGLAAGAYTASQPRDTLPMDTTGINFQTAQEAMDDPNLRFKPRLEDTQLAAEGGRIGLSNGGDPLLRKEYDNYVFELKEMHPEAAPMSFRQFREQIMAGKAEGGRIGFAGGGGSDYLEYRKQMIALGKQPMPIQLFQSLEGIMSVQEMVDMGSPEEKAEGGRIGYAKGSKKRTGIMKMLADLEERFPELMMYGSMGAGSILPFLKEGGRAGAQEGGLMDLGGMEKDYRQEGGFVPIGGKEKADDVPARLSKNEFVFTADAVRAAGGGDIDEGAAVMERLMENLEAGGKVSEDSQGLEGARGMFANAQELEKRII